MMIFISDGLSENHLVLRTPAEDGENTAGSLQRGREYITHEKRRAYFAEDKSRNYDTLYATPGLGIPFEVMEKLPRHQWIEIDEAGNLVEELGTIWDVVTDENLEEIVG
jgi:hypothetical protein